MLSRFVVSSCYSSYLACCCLSLNSCYQHCHSCCRCYQRFCTVAGVVVSARVIAVMAVTTLLLIEISLSPSNLALVLALTPALVPSLLQLLLL